MNLFGRFGGGGSQVQKVEPRTQAAPQDGGARPAPPRTPTGTGTGGAKGLAITKIQAFEDLPPYTEVMTAPRGPITIADTHRANLAIIRNEERTAWLVCPETERSTSIANTLIAKVSKNHHFGGILEASAMIVGEIYRRADKGARKSEDAVSVIAAGPSSNNEAVFLEIIRAADSDGASDVHFEYRGGANPPKATIKFRRHGEIIEYRTFDDPEQMPVIISTIYNGGLVDPKSRSAGHNIWSPEHACSCSVLINDLNGKRSKLRWQQLVENRGFDVVLRILSSNGEAKPKTLSELGYASNHVTLLDLASRSTVGMIALAGGTGSGKTTSISSMLMHHPGLGRLKIITIEDPVENDLPQTTQIPVQRSVADEGGSAFLEAMAIAMRGDPDIIYPGEIRDAVSGQLLQSMVQTGHKVYTTIHVSSAFDIPARLTSAVIGLHREVISARNFISAIAYQKLVKVLCPHCKIPAKGNISDALRKILAAKYRLELDKIYIRNHEGCSHCAGGTVGRTVCAEVVVPDMDMLDMFRAGDYPAAERAWRKTRIAGFGEEDCTGKLAIEHAIYKMSIGMVCPLDVQEEFESFETHHIVQTERGIRGPSLFGGTQSPDPGA
jgi:type II secretory ATPase GspE/PulE/Tfp pilus assembly ATPase PilB-like protein